MTSLDTDWATAAALDAADPLASLRDEFELPPPPLGADDAVYFVGNSLGPLPKRARAYINDEIDQWARLGVHGHFAGSSGWVDYHERLVDSMASLVGGLPHEVVIMNSLTVNLHLLMVSFYRPTAKRHKILIEEHAFPSDHFAVESQIRLHGHDPAASLVTIGPKPGAEVIEPEDLIAAIDATGGELAMVLLPGVQYYTGQVMPMPEVVAAARRVGATVGFDLAHAAGNIELSLHEWGADFAAWCSYKYMNASPGGVSGIWVHERHVSDRELPKLLGWWGTRLETRFEMRNEFDPPDSADSWQISNGTALPMAALRASLEVFEKAGGMGPLREKSLKLTGYLQFLLDELVGDRVESITPREPERRGCQLSLRVTADGLTGREIFDRIETAGVSCDWRHPDVIRVAPAPLFNSFTDVRRFVEILDQATSPSAAT